MAAAAAAPAACAGRSELPREGACSVLAAQPNGARRGWVRAFQTSRSEKRGSIYPNDSLQTSRSLSALSLSLANAKRQGMCASGRQMLAEPANHGDGMMHLGPIGLKSLTSASMARYERSGPPCQHCKGADAARAMSRGSEKGPPSRRQRSRTNPRRP